MTKIIMTVKEVKQNLGIDVDPGTYKLEDILIADGMKPLHPNKRKKYQPVHP